MFMKLSSKVEGTAVNEAGSKSRLNFKAYVTRFSIFQTHGLHVKVIETMCSRLESVTPAQPQPSRYWLTFATSRIPIAATFLVSHYAPPRTDDRRFPYHVPIDSRIRCAPADAKEVSSCVVL
ncbi:hypothetical protein DPMN_030893 [Dreissena polymorpha]|uniref:Uncharacterized protein n=1 Tax=Dreissena polymorpha TaxID=45954 RepID=A0A9D4LZV6_DREPO|nr:hypothetical protein DPMN_030893 [Dreissena polymorpha]